MFEDWDNRKLKLKQWSNFSLLPLLGRGNGPSVWVAWRMVLLVFGWFVGLLVRWFFDSCFDWLAGWMVGWLVGAKARAGATGVQ